jgi:stearoyl-CoA desaturase (delta-9 desaturase)
LLEGIVWALAYITLKNGDRIPLIRSFPFVAVHLACLAAFFLKFHWSYLIVCLALYYVRMFFVTAGYHRYFSHRSFKTSRVFQFVMAFMATTSTQKGVLWWAANHRHHHRYSDTDEDLHSPPARFSWSHIGWILPTVTTTRSIRSWRFLQVSRAGESNKYHLVPPVTLGVLCSIGAGNAGVGLLPEHGDSWHSRLPSTHCRTRLAAGATSPKTPAKTIICCSPW